MKKEVMFSSKTDNWSTPQWLFDQLDLQYHFDVDVCATVDGIDVETLAKCNEFFTIEDDGLSKDWTIYNSIWCNPPYGRSIYKWIAKGYFTSLNGSIVVMLLPARTDTKWFHDYCIYGDISFIKGRLNLITVKMSLHFHL